MGYSLMIAAVTVLMALRYALAVKQARNLRNAVLREHEAQTALQVQIYEKNKADLALWLVKG
jgi:hypothetical protein